MHERNAVLTPESLTGEVIVRFAPALRVSADLILGLSDSAAVPQKPDLKVTRRWREIERLPQQVAKLKQESGFLS
jgi:hypothetical protein